MGADGYRRVESVPARGVAPPIRGQADDAHTHVGDRRAGTVADGTLDRARGEAAARCGAEERGCEGERRAGWLGHNLSCYRNNIRAIGLVGAGATFSSHHASQLCSKALTGVAHALEFRLGPTAHLS